MHFYVFICCFSVFFVFVCLFYFYIFVLISVFCFCLFFLFFYHAYSIQNLFTISQTACLPTVSSFTFFSTFSFIYSQSLHHSRVILCHLLSWFLSLALHHPSVIRFHSNSFHSTSLHFTSFHFISHDFFSFHSTHSLHCSITQISSTSHSWRRKSHTGECVANMATLQGKSYSSAQWAVILQNLGPGWG